LALDLTHRVCAGTVDPDEIEMPGNVPGDAMVEYYAQRATRGGLLIAEATYVARQGNGGMAHRELRPTNRRPAGARSWMRVHAKGATILLQLWHVGRVSHTSLQPDGGRPIAPSAIDAGLRALLKEGHGAATPRARCLLAEIPAIVAQYGAAAERAKAAGFDGVEIHGANGYLIDQFLQDGSNKRSDTYGGSIENRARFLFEVVDALTGVWGPDRVGVRIGPSNASTRCTTAIQKRCFSSVAAGRDRASPMSAVQVIRGDLKR